MKDPIQSALRADVKAWSVGTLLVLVYLVLAGSSDNTITRSTQTLESDPYGVESP